MPTFSPNTQRLTEYRPRYHLMPPRYGANDLEAIFWKGEYHVFYGFSAQYPFGTPKCWGHASSADLVRWTHHKPILQAGEPYDHAGSWTGCVIIDDNGTPTAFYTGMPEQLQCMATSKDMTDWSKHPGNPVIGAWPEELRRMEGFTNFRDPHVWREEDGWYMALGSGIPGQGSATLLYRSENLTDWTYLHPLFIGPPREHEMHECPDFFPLGEDGRHVLLASGQWRGRGRTFAFVGRYTDHRFENETPLDPENLPRVDYGPCCYAAKTLSDDRGRRILWGWAPEVWSRDFCWLAGWSGVYTLPRVLTLDAKNDVAVAPAPELETLREERIRIPDCSLEAGETVPLKEVDGRELEIRTSLLFERGGRVGVSVLRTQEGHILQEETRIFYDSDTEEVVLDLEKSSLFYEENVKKGIWKMKYTAPPGEPLELRVFLDRSIVEVFVNNHRAMTGRVHPFLPESTSVAFFAEKKNARAVRTEAWRMRAVNEDTEREVTHGTP